MHQRPSVADDTDDTHIATDSTEDACDEEDAAALHPSTPIALDRATADESSPASKKEAGKSTGKRAASPEESAAATKKAKGDEKQNDQSVAKKSPARKPKKKATTEVTTKATGAASAGTKAKKVSINELLNLQTDC